MKHPKYNHLAHQIDDDLQLEFDFRLNKHQLSKLASSGHVRISYVIFKPYAEKLHQYLKVTSKRDQMWTCKQELDTLDYFIYVI